METLSKIAGSNLIGHSLRLSLFKVTFSIPSNRVDWESQRRMSQLNGFNELFRLDGKVALITGGK